MMAWRDKWAAELIEQAAAAGKMFKAAFILSLAVNAILAAVVLIKRK